MDKENKQILKYIGKRMHTFRDRRNLSRETVAKNIGVSARTIASYERGEREICMDKIILLANAYRTTVTNLINYKSVMEEMC